MTNVGDPAATAPLPAAATAANLDIARHQSFDWRSFLVAVLRKANGNTVEFDFRTRFDAHTAEVVVERLGETIRLTLRDKEYWLEGYIPP